MVFELLSLSKIIQIDFLFAFVRIFCGSIYKSIFAAGVSLLEFNFVFLQSIKEVWVEKLFFYKWI